MWQTSCCHVCPNMRPMLFGFSHSWNPRNEDLLLKFWFDILKTIKNSSFKFFLNYFKHSMPKPSPSSSFTNCFINPSFICSGGQEYSITNNLCFSYLICFNALHTLSMRYVFMYSLCINSFPSNTLNLKLI